MAHLYKSRLQNYTQKRNIDFPIYACEMDGPPHARRFRARVTIDGNTYEALEFCSTLKEAEQAAAKVAFFSLSPEEIQEDDGLHKSLLQELAQEKGFKFPAYTTLRFGPPHTPTFTSTVEIANECFPGQEARTKKHAETNAAKIAYAALIEGRTRNNSIAVSPGSQMMGASDFSSSCLQSTVTNALQPNLVLKNDEMELSIRAKSNVSAMKEEADKDKGQEKENHTAISGSNGNMGALDVSSSSLQTVVAHKSQPDVTPNVGMQLNIKPENPSTQEEQSDKHRDNNAKRNRCSLLNDDPSLPVELGITQPACEKILVRRQKPNMTYTDGTVITSDGEWVAMRVSSDQEQ